MCLVVQQCLLTHSVIRTRLGGHVSRVRYGYGGDTVRIRTRGVSGKKKITKRSIRGSDTYLHDFGTRPSPRSSLASHEHSRTPRTHAGAARPGARSSAAGRRRRRRAAARRLGGAPDAIPGEFPLSRSRRPLLFPPPHPRWPDLETSDLFLALAFFCRWLHRELLVLLLEVLAQVLVVV